MKMQEFEITKLKAENAALDEIVWHQEKEIETYKKTNKALSVMLTILVLMLTALLFMLIGWIA